MNVHWEGTVSKGGERSNTFYFVLFFLSVSGFRKTRSHLVAQIGLESATLLLQPSEWLPVMLCTQRWLVLKPHPGLSVVTIPNSEVHLEV